MPHATNTQHHACRHYGLSFPTSASMWCHIAHSPNCCAQWEIQHALRPSGSLDHHWQEHQNFTKEDFAQPNKADPNKADSNGTDSTSDKAQDEEDSSTFTCYVQPYHSPAANILGHADITFQSMRAHQDSTSSSAYSPFANHDEWELAKWLICNANQQATEEFLKLPTVSILTRIIKNKELTG